jgi:5-oxoprolinase (ATP-hydrolysing)
VLYSAVVEVDERVTLVGYTSDPQFQEHQARFGTAEKGEAKERNGYNAHIEKEYGASDGPPEIISKDAKTGKMTKKAPPIVQGVSGEAVAILKEADEEEIKKDLQALYDEGFRSAAVVLLHSFTYPRHEEIVEKVAKEVGFKHISVSSRLMPMIKVSSERVSSVNQQMLILTSVIRQMVPRGTSSTADAYLTPVLQSYIDGFFSGFDDSLRNGKAGTKVEFMMSDGGLTSVEHFSGLKSIISGPAGGVVGMALTSYDEKDGRPIIGLDMGGTSTDVSRFAGRYEQTFETTMAGVTIQSPQLE